MASVAEGYHLYESTDNQNWNWVSHSTSTQITYDPNWGSLTNGTYYYKLVAIGSCGDSSEDSNIIKVEVVAGEPAYYPYADPTQITIEPTTAGKFNIFWNYEHSTTQQNPTHFYVYHDFYDDPSGWTPSWIFDGLVTYNSGGRYRYTTQARTHDTTHIYYVAPVVIQGVEIYTKSHTDYVTATADAQGPTVITHYTTTETI